MSGWWRLGLSVFWLLVVCYPDPRVPWQSTGVPWSFPSPAEALATGLGDCQARAVTFASVLAAKGIPFQLRASIDHMWVEYPGKRPNALENRSKTLWEQRDPATG